MKNQKGITLIALIITIIVMLILVAVTVAVALEGGLFDNAKKASKETEPKAIYETIVSAMTLTDDGEINVQATAENAKATLEADGKTVADPVYERDANNNITKAILTVTGQYGEYEYEITGAGITFKDDDGGDTGEDTVTVDENTWYNVTFLKLDKTKLDTITMEDMETDHGYVIAVSDAEDSNGIADLSGTITQFKLIRKTTGETTEYELILCLGSTDYDFNFETGMWQNYEDSTDTSETITVNRVKFVSDDLIIAGGDAVFDSNDLGKIISIEETE